MIINSLPQLRTTLQFNNISTNRNQKYQLKPQLTCDCVSFGAKLPKYDNTFFMDALGRGYDSATPGIIARAKEFHSTLKNAVAKLKAYGFEYDEVYNSKCPIKKKESVLDKYERQGTAQDIIRGTIYWQDQQDIPAFKKFLEVMKDEGWEIAPLRKIDPETGDFVRNKKGNIIKFPDLEIRQSGVSSEALSVLGEFMQRAEISKPRSSTYSDWQMRFIKSKDKGMKEGRQDCEVLFLYGPHYKDAKELEHKYVYEPKRKLQKLHVDMELDHHQKGSAGYTIASNQKEIAKRLVQFVSQPLFTNAFNADLKIKDAEKLPVEISKGYAQLIKNYVKGIKKALPNYYTEMTKELTREEHVTESIKSTASYQFREDKNISSKEIKIAKQEIKDRISEWKEKDIKLINEIINDIEATIEKFVTKA